MIAARPSNGPTGGTYKLSQRHGVSYPIPHNAAPKEVVAALIYVGEMDRRITAEHDANPALAAACTVCNPPVWADAAWWDERPWMTARRWLRRVFRR